MEKWDAYSSFYCCSCSDQLQGFNCQIYQFRKCWKQRKPHVLVPYLKIRNFTLKELKNWKSWMLICDLFGSAVQTSLKVLAAQRMIFKTCFTQRNTHGLVLNFKTQENHLKQHINGKMGCLQFILLLQLFRSVSRFQVSNI